MACFIIIKFKLEFIYLHAKTQEVSKQIKFGQQWIQLLKNLWLWNLVISKKIFRQTTLKLYKLYNYHRDIL